MNLSISNIAWSVELDETVLGFISGLGFQGLEIAPTRIFPSDPYLQPSKAQAWAEGLNQKWGLRVSSMQSIWFGRTEMLFGTTEEREALVAYTKLALDFAQSIGCPNLVFGNPRNRRQNQADLYDPIGLEFFREIADYAALRNTVIALEPNPEMYGTNFVTTTQEAFDLARMLNHPGLRVNFDLGAVLANNERLDPLKTNLDLVSHIHISEPGLIPIEPRQIHQELAAILRDSDYQKFVSIEMKNCQDVEPVKAAAQWLKEVFR